MYIVGPEEERLFKEERIYTVTHNSHTIVTGVPKFTPIHVVSAGTKKDKQTRIGDLIVEKNPATVIVHSWCSLANEDRL